MCYHKLRKRGKKGRKSQKKDANRRGWETTSVVGQIGAKRKNGRKKEEVGNAVSREKRKVLKTHPRGEGRGPKADEGWGGGKKQNDQTERGDQRNSRGRFGRQKHTNGYQKKVKEKQESIPFGV